MINKKFLISILLAIFVFMIVIPTSFAEDSETTLLSDTDGPPALPDGEMPNGTAPPDMGNGTAPPDMGNSTAPPDMGNGTEPPIAPTDDTQTSTLSADDLIKVYGGDEDFEVIFTDADGSAIIGQHLSINLTRVSSGASKTYDVVTDYAGIASLPINLAQGYYTAFTSFTAIDGFNYTNASISNTITVISKEDENKTGTTISANALTKLINETASFTATLTDTSGNVIAGQHIALTLARPSSGASKTYDVVTDYLGIASLPINLAVGTYTATAQFEGNDEYSGSSASATIIVTENSQPVTGGRLVVNGTSQTVTSGTYTTSDSDTNTVLVTNGGTLQLTGATITKYGDTADQGENSEFYGTNAGVLVQARSTLNITDSTIITNATGANAVFSTNMASSNSGSTIYISNVDINTYKDKSRGLDATYGGIIIADNVTINTRGGSCAALATDRGEGTVTATNCILNTGVDSSQTSAGSPVIYSTGAITAINCTGTAYQSQIGCIEGKNSITLINSNLSGYGKGNRQSGGEYVDLGGFFIYQSMSGDADVGTATLNATNSILSIPSASTYYTTAPMFHVTNTAAIINLNNCTLNFGSGTLLDVSGQDQWGTTGSNGGKLTFTATNQDLTGNIEIDSISTLSLTLTNSNYNGAINPSGTYGTTNVVISAGSTWTLTGNSYVTSLSNSGTINRDSYKLYVNGVEYTG